MLEELLVAAEDIRGLHGSSFLGAKEALDHLSLLKAKCEAVIAHPIIFSELFNTEARLMYRHRAVYTEDNLVMILIVATATDGTASIVLSDLSPLQIADIFDIVLELLPLGFVYLLAITGGLVHFVHLIHDLPVPQLVPFLLRQLQFL